MTFAIGSFTTKTARDIHDDYLRTVRNGLIQNGVPNPQLGPGSDEDIYATAIANELAPVYANTVIMADAQMPDTATGTVPAGQLVGADLQRLMATVGLAPRPAGPSAGFITLDCSATTTIPDGSQLIDSAGTRFQVATPGSYAAASLVPVIGVDTGSKTNHLAGDTLTWVAAPPYCNTKQLVATGGLTGGSDAENNDTARARLLNRLQNPPGSGNWSQTCGYAEASSAIVQKAFNYPAVNGPSTSHVAVVAYTSSTSKSRVVNATVMAGTVVPYVLGQMPEFVEVVTTTVADQPVDIAIGLSLPASPQASPAGPGGGWIDGTPWPAISGVQTYANVTAITSSTNFTVNAPSSPTAGVTHICTIDTTTWTLLRAKVLTVSGSAGAYVITTDTPFPNLTTGPGTGSLIFPDATNMQAYVAAFFSAMALMGPGEKTANVSVLTRGYRHPLPQSAWPYSLGAVQLKSLSNSGAEVLDVNYYYRSATTPTVPGAVSSPPNCLIPRNLAFYPI